MLGARSKPFLVTPAILMALGAAVLFGASTPFAKWLLGDAPPILLAGLLYLGSGIGLGILRVLRDLGWRKPDLPASQWPWLIGAISFGGVLGPILLLVGLTHTSASSASLLLNLEAVLTATLAWIVFRENADRRIVLGMVLIVVGGGVLAWPGSGSIAGGDWGALAIVGACLCWAIDNNLTRKVSESDAVFIAGLKGLTAGIINTGLALLLDSHLPSVRLIGAAMLVGLFAYGISLVLFVMALRDLGTARTSAYFSVAPFIGAVIAVIGFNAPVSPVLWVAALLMATGVWLHLWEWRDHVHPHPALMHIHAHIHDRYHQHDHDFPWDGTEPHTHVHTHL